MKKLKNSLRKINGFRISSKFEIEVLSKALEKLKIPTFNIKMEENPMEDTTIIT